MKNAENGFLEDFKIYFEKILVARKFLDLNFDHKKNRAGRNDKRI